MAVCASVCVCVLHHSAWPDRIQPEPKALWAWRQLQFAVSLLGQQVLFLLPAS